MSRREEEHVRRFINPSLENRKMIKKSLFIIFRAHVLAGECQDSYLVEKPSSRAALGRMDFSGVHAAAAAAMLQSDIGDFHLPVVLRRGALSPRRRENENGHAVQVGSHNILYVFFPLDVQLSQFARSLIFLFS